MSGFSAASVTPLSYDFTLFPLDGSDNGARCTGKGRIPEPSKRALEAFFREFEAVFRPGVDEAPSDDDVVHAVEDLEDQIYGLLSNVCSGQPSPEELKQLPPRILAAFTRYLLENLAPKA